MKKLSFAISSLLALAAVTVVPSRASAVEKWDLTQKLFLPEDHQHVHEFRADVSIYSNGKYTKAFKVHGWPCLQTDPGGSDTCACGMVVAMKGKNGASVGFSAEGKMSTSGFSADKDGTSKVIADHFKDFSAESVKNAQMQVRCEGKSPGWFGSFLTDLFGDIGKALGVVGPLLALLSIALRPSRIRVAGPVVYW